MATSESIYNENGARNLRQTSGVKQGDNTAKTNGDTTNTTTTTTGMTTMSERQAARQDVVVASLGSSRADVIARDDDDDAHRDGLDISCLVSLNTSPTNKDK